MLKKELNELISHYEKDTVVIGLIESALKACWRYMVAVNELELFIMTSRSSADGQEYRDIVSSMDRNRSFAHNSLISDVTAMCRLCVKADIKPIFRGNVDNRVEVAEFAKKVVVEIFEKRRM